MPNLHKLLVCRDEIRALCDNQRDSAEELKACKQLDLEHVVIGVYGDCPIGQPRSCILGGLGPLSSRPAVRCLSCTRSPTHCEHATKQATSTHVHLYLFLRRRSAFTSHEPRPFFHAPSPHSGFVRLSAPLSPPRDPILHILPTPTAPGKQLSTVCPAWRTISRTSTSSRTWTMPFAQSSRRSPSLRSTLPCTPWKTAHK